MHQLFTYSTIDWVCRISGMTSHDRQYADARYLSQLLVSIAEQAKADFADTVAPLGLPIHLARAVLLLDQPAPMRDLADQLACDRSYITNLADQLEELELVERVPGQDRRVKLLALTKKGVQTRDAISKAVAERSMLLQRLTDAQRETLRPLLELLAGQE